VAFDFARLDPQDVRLEDIAHALSLQCRFNGHCREFYSVAQHSVLVSLATPPGDAVWGLLHDATEAYCGDLVRPLKRLLPEFDAIEGQVLEIVAQRFGLVLPMPASVKAADDVLLATEARDLLGGTPREWETLPPPLADVIVPMTPRDAHDLFLERARALGVAPVAPPAAEPAPTNVRTSLTNPIRVAWIAHNVGPRHGRVGLTFAPGKRGPALVGKPWARDLGLDLDRLRDVHGVDVLVSLIADSEIALLHLEEYEVEANRRGIAVLRSPIPDTHAPTPAQADVIVEAVLAHARAGRRVVVHCRGGLGRAGTIGACVLVRLGREATVAIAETRAARPGAIETREQEDFVAAWARR
jgi:hypothetical protein